MHSHYHGPGARATILVAGLVTLSGAAWGQTLHDTDIVIRVGGDGAIETGLVEPGGVAWGERVVRGRLDLAQFENLADDPGFDSTSGAFPPGTAIGFDLLAALRWWDGASFETIDPEYRMSVTKGSSVVTTPGADGAVAGFTFGSADSGGRFHHHVRFFLDPYDPFTAVDGLWLLQMRLWSTNAAVGASEPIFLVFASGAEALSEQDEAVAWVEANLVGPGGCNPADLAEPFGLLDLADISAFAGAFVAQGTGADLAEPFGVFDLSDITAFVGAFQAGCP